MLVPFALPTQQRDEFYGSCLSWWPRYECYGLLSVPTPPLFANYLSLVVDNKVGGFNYVTYYMAFQQFVKVAWTQCDSDECWFFYGFVLSIVHDFLLACLIRVSEMQVAALFPGVLYREGRARFSYITYQRSQYYR